MSKPELHLRRYVDMWAVPGLHPTNVDLLQQLKTADTQHFTKNMDVVGTVSEWDRHTDEWQKSHMIGIRTDIWKPDSSEMQNTLSRMQKKRQQELKQRIKRTGKLNQQQASVLEEQLEADNLMQLSTSDLLKQRLVLKLFKTTGKRVRWCGTIEEVTTAEIHNSWGSRRTLLSLAVMLPRQELVTHVQQNHRTARVPSVFTFCFLSDEQMWHLRASRRWFSIGADFDLTANGKPLGKLDGKLFTLGADSYVNVFEHPLAEDNSFADLLTLFASSVGFHRAMRKHVRRRVKAVLQGNPQAHVIDDEELRLRHNGRAAA